jgi:hypothetical protein
MTGLTAASTALNIAKSLRSIEKGYDAVSYKTQIVDLIDALTDAKMALTDAREAISERDKEIQQLRSSFEERAALVKGDGDYKYIADTDGKPVGYPICPSCEPVRGRIIQLKELDYTGQAICPGCSMTFKPVTCYLPKGSSHPTKQDRDAAAWEAASKNSSNSPYY